MRSKSYEDPVFVVHRRLHSYKILYVVRVGRSSLEEKTKRIFARSGIQAAADLINGDPDFNHFVQINDEGVAKGVIENASKTFVPLLKGKKCESSQKQS